MWQAKKPKNNEKYHWTQHVMEKMHYYGLSEQKVLGVIRKPFRVETGVAENTVAVMIPVGNVKKAAAAQKKTAFSKVAAKQLSSAGESWNQEIWVMYQIKNQESRNKNQEDLQKAKKIAKLKVILASKKKIHDSKFMIPNSANRKICIISAWRFPGMSSEKDPIPAEIWREIEELNLL